MNGESKFKKFFTDILLNPLTLSGEFIIQEN